MVRVMGLYKLNEFLTLEDVAEYLTDKGIYNFDLMDGIDQRKLCELIIKLHRENKITPVFYCSAIGEIHNVNFDDPVKSTITKAQINEYLILSDWGIDEVFRDNQIINIQPFDVLQTYISEIYYTGFSYHVSINDIYFPKFDLDQIFYELTNQDPLAYIENQRIEIHRLTDELNQANAKIAELEQQATQPSDTATDEPLKGIAKVNYDKDKAKAFASIVAKFLWNIDTNQQLRIGEMATQLYPLIHEFDNNALPQGNDTIKDWIRPHAPKYASKAGNTPKSQPPIILTLKK